MIKLSLRKRSGEVFQPTNRNDFHFWCILKEQPEMPDPSRSKVRPRRDHSATRRMCLWCGCYAHSNWSDRGTGGGIAQGQNFSCIVLRDLSWWCSLSEDLWLHPAGQWTLCGQWVPAAVPKGGRVAWAKSLSLVTNPTKGLGRNPVQVQGCPKIGHAKIQGA